MGICISRDSGFQLPEVNAEKGVEGQGWKIATEVKASAIPDSGNGRYAKEAAAKGDVVLVKTSVPMTGVEDLKTVPLDTMLVFENVEEIDKYVKLAVAEGHTKERVMTTIKHFMHGFSDKQCLLNVSAYTVNHKDEKMGGLNLEINEKVEDGKSTWVCTAKEDIKEGDELMIDYRRFKIPKFYEEYAKENGFADVRTFVLECVYGKNGGA